MHPSSLPAPADEKKETKKKKSPCLVLSFASLQRSDRLISLSFLSLLLSQCPSSPQSHVTRQGNRRIRPS